MKPLYSLLSFLFSPFLFSVLSAHFSANYFGTKNRDMEGTAMVEQWIRSGMGYDEGTDLLVRITGKQYYSGQFMGKERAMAEKLAYLLCTASGVASLLTWKDFIAGVQGKVLAPLPNYQAKPEIAKEVAQAGQPAMELEENLGTKPLAEYPTVIRRIIHEYASLFQERGKLHSVMAGLPESNAETVCAKRKELFDLVKSISARLEILYIAKNNFDEKGIIPEDNEVFPPIENEVAAPNFSTMDEATLKKQKKNLQSSNSKDQTMLDYQATEKAETKNPMPKGPKRAKIENRVGQRNQKIEEIDNLLLQHVGKE